MIAVTDLKTGAYFEEGGVPFEVLKYEHSKLGRGKANIKVKVRNLLNGAIVTKTFLSGHSVAEAELDKKGAEFKYRTREACLFEGERGEEIEVGLAILGGKESFFKKGFKLEIVLFKDQPIAVELPVKVVYLVKEAPPDARGDTATASYKEVILENGLKVKVPMFIQEGDEIVVDTRKGEYVKRSRS